MSRREFLDFILEQMSLLPGLRSRSMFGGFGIYQGERFFALIADDRLFLKVDDVNRPDFEARGLRPFQYPGRDGQAMTMQYYEVPPEAYDDRECMRDWAQSAIQAAGRAATSGRSKSRSRRASGRAARSP